MSTSPPNGSFPPTGTALLEAVSQELQKRIRKEQFETWFRGFDLVQADEAEVLFAVPNGFVRDWITRNYLPDLSAAVAIVTHRRPRVRVTYATTSGPVLLELAGPSAAPTAASTAADNPAPIPAGALNGAACAQFSTAVRSSIGDVEQAFTAAPPASNGHVVEAVSASRPAGAGVHLNSTYTFEEFVEGPCNRLAYSAALAIGETPGRAYNPFFVHGNVGLGKTHLLQAICHAILRRQPNSKVIFVSCEEFTNRFIDSIQNRTVAAFREYHRSADVLVIDDVEFLSHKAQTQEEFFHTFNALYNRQAQIVLSSDRRAPEIPTLEERLVSRFKWGLETDMTQPCYETRAAIVKRKARMRNVDLPVDVVRCLAETVTSNIRELEGAVTKVLGLSTITGRKIDLALAEEALRDGVVTRGRLVTMPDVMDLVTSQFPVTAQDLTGKSRTQAVSLPRQIAMYLCRRHTEYSLDEVGRFFGDRDHTTVLYAVGKIRRRCDQDRPFQELVGTLSQRLVTSTPAKMRR